LANSLWQIGFKRVIGVVFGLRIAVEKKPAA